MTYSPFGCTRTLLTSKVELLREVVFERKLKMDVFGSKTVAEVNASSPDDFRAYHHAIGWIEQDISRSVVTAMKGVVRLPVRIRDVEHRVTNRAGKSFVPG